MLGGQLLLALGLVLLEPLDLRGRQAAQLLGHRRNGAVEGALGALLPGRVLRAHVLGRQRARCGGGQVAQCVGMGFSLKTLRALWRNSRTHCGSFFTSQM